MNDHTYPRVASPVQIGFAPYGSPLERWTAMLDEMFEDMRLCLNRGASGEDPDHEKALAYVAELSTMVARWTNRDPAGG